MAPRLEGSSGGAEDPRTGLGSDPKARILLSGDIESNPGPPRRFENDNSDDKLVLLAENVDNVGKEGGILCRVVGMVAIKLAFLPSSSNCEVSALRTKEGGWTDGRTDRQSGGREGRAKMNWKQVQESGEGIDLGGGG